MQAPSLHAPPSLSSCHFCFPAYLCITPKDCPCLFVSSVPSVLLIATLQLIHLAPWDLPTEAEEASTHLFEEGPAALPLARGETFSPAHAVVAGGCRALKSLSGQLSHPSHSCPVLRCLPLPATSSALSPSGAPLLSL